MASILATTWQQSLYRRFARAQMVAPVTSLVSSSLRLSRPYTTQPASYSDGDLISTKGRFDLTGRNYVVTGGGRGIGYAAVRAIAEAGGNISVLDAAAEPTKDFHGLVGEFGIKTAYIRTDVTDETSLTSAFAQTADQFGSLHGW